MSTVSVINTCYISAMTAVGFMVWPCKSRLSMLNHGLDCMRLINYKFTLPIHSKALTITELWNWKSVHHSFAWTPLSWKKQKL